MAQTDVGFVGSWFVTVFETDGPPTRGLLTFAQDGTIVTAEHPVVTPPGAPSAIITSSGHGAWRTTGKETAVLTVLGLGSALNGTLFTVVTFRASASLSPDGQAISGNITATIDDPEGRMMAVFPMTFEGRRIVAEAPELSAMSRPANAAPTTSITT